MCLARLLDSLGDQSLPCFVLTRLTVGFVLGGFQNLLPTNSNFTACNWQSLCPVGSANLWLEGWSDSEEDPLKDMTLKFLPLLSVSPVSGGHLALVDVLCVASFESFVSFAAVRRAGDSLLAEANGFDLIAFFSDDHVGFGGVGRCALRGVDTGDANSGEE